jgi:type VI protein secretion system component VasA
VAQLRDLFRRLSFHDCRQALPEAEAVVALDSERLAERVTTELGSGLVAGTRITVTLNRPTLRERSLGALGETLQGVFRRLAPVNGFLQLVLRDVDGSIFHRWPAVTGES